MPMDPSVDLLPPLHPPGRSRTVPAWSALIAFLILLSFGFLYSFLLKESISALLRLSEPFTGVTIQAETLPVTLKGPLRLKNVVLTSGAAPHQSHLEFQAVSIEMTSLGRIIFGDHQLIQKVEADKGKGLIDLRHTSSLRKPSFLELQTEHLQKLFQEKMMKLPESIVLQDISLLCITEEERYNIEHFFCFLPKKIPGTISYESLLLETGAVQCHLSKGNCDSLWDGKTITIKNLLLADDIDLHHLKLTVHPDRLDIGLIATISNGLLRADGCLRQNGPNPILEGALFGEQLSIERLSKFLGLQKKISGTLREGRLIFRGSPMHPIDSEASLRMHVDHFRFKKKEWASLSVASNYIGRKISITELQLKQQDNRVNAVGEMSLPEDWLKLGEAPFHCKLKATITDAAQLIDLLGRPCNDINGKLFIDGDIIGGANRAEGYLHLQGTEMSLYGLPIDFVESTLLFHGERTLLSHLDLWNGSSHLQLSGSMANSWPHYYEAEGTIKCRSFFEKWKPLEKWVDGATTSTRLCNVGANKNVSADTSKNSIPLNYDSTTARGAPSIQQSEEEPKSLQSIQTGLYHQLPILKNIQGGLFQAHWKANGTAQKHEGSFEMKLQEAKLKNQPFEFHTTGSYKPEFVTCPIFKIHSGKSSFSTSLTLTPLFITLPKLVFQENGESTLSGSITLPIDGIRLLGGHPFGSLLEWNQSMEVNLALHHFSSDVVSVVTGLPVQNMLIDGSIQSSGRWEEPSAKISLSGRRLDAKSNTPFHLELSSKKGEGCLDTSLGDKNGYMAQLHGTLPIGFMPREEETLLKEKDFVSLSPLNGPLHLSIMLPESPLDFFTQRFLPQEIDVQHATVCGELGLQGTLTDPELTGHLSLKAEECRLGSILAPLQGLKASLSLSKGKITLESGSAFLGKGKLEITGSSKGNIGEMHHEYHFNGHELLLFQKENAIIKGRAALLLQGDQQGGKLHGNITITELDWKPQLTMTPFLLPPGILLKSPSPPLPNVSSWKSDVTLECDTKNSTHPTSSSDRRNSFTDSCFKKIDLHVCGPLGSPYPEGALELSQLSIQSPQGPLHFLEGGIHFSSHLPWRPLLQLSAKIKVGRYKIITHLDERLEEPALSLESVPFLSEETAALLLGQPTRRFSSKKSSAGWMAQLPFWIRQQEIEESTTIAQPPLSPINTTEQRDNLGFEGLGIFYHAELK